MAKRAKRGTIIPTDEEDAKINAGQYGQVKLK